ncbi:MAG: ribonuclease H-like domain-containing protein [Candidatus Anammoxibacter sp.]
MIDKTFIHCHGIGSTYEKKLYDAGFKDWQSVLTNPNDLPFNSKLATGLIKELTRSSIALNEGDIRYLVRRFPVREHWRILGHFFDKASYFDIETTDIAFDNAIVTLIVCYHKGKFYRFMRDENLDDFLDLLKDIELLVSFNGNSFDVPFILKNYHIPDIPCAHIDLRWQCYHCQYKHGLKNIEYEMGIQRPDDLQGIDGLEAVYLWHNWKNGDFESKKRLIRYCSADVLSLQLIAGNILRHRGIEVELPLPSELWGCLEML